jgi:hypothetical protein
MTVTDEPREPIDTTNDFAVGASGDGMVTIALLPPRMTRGQALRMAAWIVAIADPTDEWFPPILDAVRGT